MDGTDLIDLVRFNNWSNERLLRLAAAVPEEDLRVPAGLDHGSVYDTLLHLIDSQWSWRLACEVEGFSSAPLWEIEALDGLAALTDYWQKDSLLLETYVEGLTANGLERLVQPSWHRVGHTYSVRHILFHILFHAANHRSEISARFTKLGHSGGDVEFINFLLDTDRA